MPEYRVDGFVIVPPINPWDEKNKDKIWIDMGYSSFGKNAVEAWLRFTGYPVDDPDWSRKIQHWHDRGYRLKKAAMVIYDE